MAPRQAAARQQPNQTEAEFTRDLTAAVASTEAEILADALSEEAEVDEVDTSLEEMGDGLEGDDLSEEETADEDADQSEEGEEDAGDQGEDDEAEGDIDDGADRRPLAARDQRGEDRRDGRQPIRGVPPELHRRSNERARTAESRNSALERELAETRGRLDALSAQVNAPPRQQQQQEKPDPEPDMFADPDGWKAWNRRQVQQETQRLVRQELTGVRQEFQARDEERLNTAFDEAMSGPQGFEVMAAHRALLSTLSPQNPRDRATVVRITRSADPIASLLDWFEDNGGPEYRANVARQLGYEVDDGYTDDRGTRQVRRGVPQRGQGRGQVRQGQGQQQVRHVIRQPASLNSARGGGNRQQNIDPRVLDDSDGSVFHYAAQR
jgi:hypothetical protein